MYSRGKSVNRPQDGETNFREEKTALPCGRAEMLFFFIVVQVLCEELLFFLRCGFGLFLFCLALFLQVLEQKGKHKEEKADRPDGKAHGDIDIDKDKDAGGDQNRGNDRTDHAEIFEHKLSSAAAAAISYKGIIADRAPARNRFCSAFFQEMPRAVLSRPTTLLLFI